MTIFNFGHVYNNISRVMNPISVASDIASLPNYEDFMYLVLPAFNSYNDFVHIFLTQKTRIYTPDMFKNPATQTEINRLAAMNALGADFSIVAMPYVPDYAPYFSYHPERRGSWVDMALPYGALSGLFGETNYTPDQTTDCAKEWVEHMDVISRLADNGRTEPMDEKLFASLAPRTYVTFQELNKSRHYELTLGNICNFLTQVFILSQYVETI